MDKRYSAHEYVCELRPPVCCSDALHTTSKSIVLAKTNKNNNKLASWCAHTQTHTHTHATAGPNISISNKDTRGHVSLY